MCLFVSVSCCKDREKDPMVIGKTVLVYMASNNNLSVYSAEDYSDLKSGFVPEWFDEGNGDILLVYRHAYGQKPHLIRLSAMDGAVREDTLIYYPAQNSCMDTTFRKVMRDAFGSYPSTERGLYLSSHGTGWLPEGYYTNPVDYDQDLNAVQSAAPGSAGTGRVLRKLPVQEDPYAWMVKTFGHEINDKEMEIGVLKQSLTYHLDWLVFDCCLMGGVEVAYELKDVCDYIAFSPAEILADGFPYDGLMEIAFRSGSDVPTRVKGMADLYFKHYDSQTSEDKRAATISVVKCSELPALAASVKEILAGGGRERISSLRIKDDELVSVQRYFRMGKHWFYDLDDYVSQICPDDALYSNFTAAMGRAVIYMNATPSFMPGYGGFRITHYSGLSSYVPRPANGYLDSYYKKLDWGVAIGF